MADYKPKTPSSSSSDPIEILLILGFLTLIGGFLLERIISFSRAEGSFLEVAYSYFINVFYVIMPLSFVISSVFLFGIIYSLRKLSRLNRELKLKFHSQKSDFDSSETVFKKAEERWGKILEHLESFNMSDWKMAILEADIMLEEMVDKMGYPGVGLGEKLKNIERSDFNTLDKAWEAHKIRNTIAHEGTSFYITQSEAKRVIGLFEEVFKEFKYI